MADKAEPGPESRPVADPFHGKRNRSGAKKGKRPVPPYLRDLRAVYAQSEDRDATPAQKALRETFKADIQKYVAMLSAAERSHEAGRRKMADRVAAGAPEPKAVDLPADAGTEKQLGLVDKLLADFEAGDRA